MNIKKIKSIYEELMGYLSQAPNPEKQPYIHDEELWNQVHTCIDELNNLSEEDYSHFKMSLKSGYDGKPMLDTVQYRSKLNGLIMNLHAEFFDKENMPFSGVPTAIFQQNQEQSVQTQLILITEIQSLVDKQLYTAKDLKDEEKTFLEKIKSVLPTMKTAAELISQVITIARSLGLNIDQIAHALGL